MYTNNLLYMKEQSLPETLYTPNIRQTTDNIQQNTDIMNK